MPSMLPSLSQAQPFSRGSPLRATTAAGLRDYKYSASRPGEYFSPFPPSRPSTSHSTRSRSSLKSQYAEVVRTPLAVEGCTPLDQHDFNRIYSGKLGKEPTIKRRGSEESINTDISLLTCTWVEPVPLVPMRVKKSRSVQSTPDMLKEPKKSPWEKLARKRNNALDSLRKREWGEMAVYTTADEEYETEAEKLLGDEEKFLLRSTARTRGINNRKKSASMTDLRAQERFIAPTVKIACGADPTFVYQKHRMRSGSVGRKGVPTKRTRTLGDEEGLLPDGEEEEGQAVVTLTQLLEMSKLIDKQFSHKIEGRILKTLDGLDRLTLGIDPYFYIEEILKHFVGKDYACIPFMPQKIRITPSLNTIIRHDIQLRMGRPRYHEIRQQDVRFFDEDNPYTPASRNLMVFNWLHGLDEDSFLEKRVPDNHTLDAFHRYDGDTAHVEAADEPDQQMFSGAQYDFKQDDKDEQTPSRASSARATSAKQKRKKNLKDGRLTGLRRPKTSLAKLGL